MGSPNSLHPTTQIYTIQITLVINLESTDHQFGVSDYQHSLDILVFNFKMNLCHYGEMCMKVQCSPNFKNVAP